MPSPESESGEARGSCLCGAVRYRVADAPPVLTACHCGQCRKMTGSYMVALDVPKESLVIEDGESQVRWYRASSIARRGFCGRCGSTLFWWADDAAWVDIAAGTLDSWPPGLRLKEHIYVADKPDWYELTDSLPQLPTERERP